jgi:AraC-like DNA-binding protein
MAQARCANLEREDLGRSITFLVRDRHAHIMRKYYLAIDNQNAFGCGVSEFCFKIGVPPRTLIPIFQTTLGTIPKSLPVFRRTNLAENDLRQSEAGTTVTDVASDYGLRDVGRFAIQYRGLFRESPSLTRRNAIAKRVSDHPAA